MALVRGHDAWTRFEFAENSTSATWGDTPSGTSPQEWKAVPILSESLTLDRDLFPTSREFGTTGGVEFVEYGRGLVRGSVTFHPRYNQEWMWGFFAQFFGDEVVNVDQDLIGGTLATSNRHSFVFTDALTRGFACRVWKGGAAASQGYIETFLGCMISRLVWEQPAGDIARVTLDIVGKSVSIASASGNPSSVGALNGGSVVSPQFVKIRDLSSSPAGVFVSTGLTEFNHLSFTLTADRKLTPEPAFANSPDSIEQPGVVETREVTLELQSVLETDYNASNKPYREYIDKTESRARIIYESTAVVAGAQEYSIMLDLPKLIWTDAQASVSEPGAPPTRFTGRAILGTPASPATPPSTQTDFRMICVVKPADDSSAAWSVL